MKKIIFAVALVASAVMFNSCSENFIDDLFDKVDGNSTAVIGNSENFDFTTSIAVIDKKAASPFALGLSMQTTLTELLDVENIEELQFPFMSYRVVGKKIKSGAQFTANNEITETDLEDFDYHSLINGKYANNNIVCVALTDSKFLVMKSGTIDLKKVSKTKIKGSYNGSAYVVTIIDDKAVIEPDLVSLSGEFNSRITPMMGWLNKIQED